jgi:hypothetical protein
MHWFDSFQTHSILPKPYKNALSHRDKSILSWFDAGGAYQYEQQCIALIRFKHIQSFQNHTKTT